MLNVDDYILGNRLLHRKLCIAAELLAEFVRVAPRPLNAERLLLYTGHPKAETMRLLHALTDAGMLRADAIARNAWSLACDPAEVTLEDVFRCISADPGFAARQTDSAQQGDAISNDVGLLLMQAVMEVNQGISAGLRQFTLDRLKHGSSGMLRATSRPSRTVNSALYRDIGGGDADALPEMPVMQLAGEPA